jgi:amino acid permease
MVFPLSLMRTVGALRYTAMFGFASSVIIILSIVMMCLFDREVNPNLQESFEAAVMNFNITPFKIFNSFPLILFGFMY